MMSEEQNSGLTPYRWVECGKDVINKEFDYCVIILKDKVLYGELKENYNEEIIFTSNQRENQYNFNFLELEEILKQKDVISWAYCEIEEPEY